MRHCQVERPIDHKSLLSFFSHSYLYVYSSLTNWWSIQLNIILLIAILNASLLINLESLECLISLLLLLHNFELWNPNRFILLALLVFVLYALLMELINPVFLTLREVLTLLCMFDRLIVAV